MPVKISDIPKGVGLLCAQEGVELQILLLIVWPWLVCLSLSLC